LSNKVLYIRNKELKGLALSVALTGLSVGANGDLSGVYGIN
jgi:hypothetical protein